MKHIALAALLATTAVAAQAHTYFDNARVSNVEPRYESVRVPRQECSNQWVNEPREPRESRRSGVREYGGAVLGGVAGAVLGHQVGGGHGRDAATAIGAVLGAFTGDRLANRGRWDEPEQATREVTSCRDVEDVQSRINGYQVTYEYRGQQFTTLMNENPGPFLKVRVSVEPVGR